MVSMFNIYSNSEWSSNPRNLEYILLSPLLGALFPYLPGRWVFVPLRLHCIIQTFSLRWIMPPFSPPALCSGLFQGPACLIVFTSGETSWFLQPSHISCSSNSSCLMAFIQMFSLMPSSVFCLQGEVTYFLILGISHTLMALTSFTSSSAISSEHQNSVFYKLLSLKNLTKLVHIIKFCRCVKYYFFC